MVLQIDGPLPIWQFQQVYDTPRLNHKSKLIANRVYLSWASGRKDYFLDKEIEAFFAGEKDQLVNEEGIAVWNFLVQGKHRQSLELIFETKKYNDRTYDLESYAGVVEKSVLGFFPRLKRA